MVISAARVRSLIYGGYNWIWEHEMMEESWLTIFLSNLSILVSLQTRIFEILLREPLQEPLVPAEEQDWCWIGSEKRVEVETNSINQTNVRSEQGLTVFQGNGIIWLELVNTETYGKYFMEKLKPICPIVYLIVNPWDGIKRCINNNSHFKYDQVLIRKACILCCSVALEQPWADSLLMWHNISDKVTQQPTICSVRLIWPLESLDLRKMLNFLSLKRR